MPLKVNRSCKSLIPAETSKTKLTFSVIRADACNYSLQLKKLHWFIFKQLMLR